MLYSCALISSSRSFHLVLGLWCYIMWHVMWLQYHMPLHRLKEKEKKRKRKIVSVQAFYNSTPLLGFYFQKNFFFILSDPLTHLLISLLFHFKLSSSFFIYLSRSLKVDSIFISLFILFSFSFSFSTYFLFLELELGLSDKDHAVTWHSHKSHDTRKDVECQDHWW